MSNTTTSKLFGLVLSGGKSSRMGRDKGTIVVHGKPQKEYLLEELDAVCEKVFLSAKDEAENQAGNSITDSFNIDSPLNGILSALEFAPSNAWLVVAVDMPNVDRAVLKFLVDARDPMKVATCFYNKETSLPEPLLSIWEPSAFASLKKFAEAGEVSPRAFLAISDIHLVDPPDPKVFYNMNTPEDIV